MAPLDLPAPVEAVLREFRTCELSTFAKDGTPVTWPVSALYQREQARFLLTTSIGLPDKAFNIRRNPRVSLLFSDATASGLIDPPTVLVQGNAEAPDELVAETAEFEEMARLIFPRQPAAEAYSANGIMRRLFDWYYMRLAIRVTPRRILWWDRGDLRGVPHETRGGDVG
jgi:nitroimidazol reductase NimA-like FMN-containing flavoprotein (pyridoxamine 5'-phosphate oxidase superfamily)